MVKENSKTLNELISILRKRLSISVPVKGKLQIYIGGMEKGNYLIEGKEIQVSIFDPHTSFLSTSFEVLEGLVLGELSLLTCLFLKEVIFSGVEVQDISIFSNIV